jgi:hypothetical protein
VAAAASYGLRSVGVELNADYFLMAAKVIPDLARLSIVKGNSNGTK